jgi:hypothetical protein
MPVLGFLDSRLQAESKATAHSILSVKAALPPAANPRHDALHAAREQPVQSPASPDPSRPVSPAESLHRVGGRYAGPAKPWQQQQQQASHAALRSGDKSSQSSAALLSGRALGDLVERGRHAEPSAKSR